MRIKNIIKIIIVLIILVCLGFGIFKLYNLAKDSKYWDGGTDNNKTREVLSEEKESEESSINNKKEEDKDTKQDKTKREETKQKSSSNSSSIDTTKGIDTKKEKEEVITYYKSLNCETEEHEDDMKIYVNVRGDFLATKYQTFSKDTELSVSIIEMKVSIKGYDELTEEEKKEIDKTLKDEGDEFLGYNLTISHNDSWIIYTWKGNKNSFLKTFDDFGSNKVSYTNYERYFNKEGITCRES